MQTEEQPKEKATVDIMNPSSLPVYMYKDFWLHQVYCVGLESFVKRISGNVPHVEHDDAGVRMTKGMGISLFYWQTAFTSDGGYTHGLPKINVFGKTLYARTVESKTKEFKPIVHVRYGPHDNATPPGVVCGGLYAARSFGVGDPITFFSNLEESNGESLLGGVHVRKVDHPPSEECLCNAYLTVNRTLRCKRVMKKGDEITRCMNCGILDYLERADSVVISLNTMSIGRVRYQFPTTESNCLVYYPHNNMVEMATPMHFQVFKDQALVKDF